MAAFDKTNMSKKSRLFKARNNERSRSDFDPKDDPMCF